MKKVTPPKTVHPAKGFAHTVPQDHAVKGHPNTQRTPIINREPTPSTELVRGTPASNLGQRHDTQSGHAGHPRPHPAIPARSMSLQLSQSVNVGMAQVLEPRLDDSFYESVNYWTHAEHHSIEFESGGKTHVVPFAYASPEWIESIVPDETFGIYVGDMMFINSDILAKHPQWVPFVIIKLYAERFVNVDGDRTGKTKHYESLFRTIRLAYNILETDDLRLYLTKLMEHERTGYFEWDEQAKRFLDGHDDTASAKRAYLAAHQDNQWVRQGRTIEALAELGDSTALGFRNHAEAISGNFSGAEAVLIYSAAYFVAELLKEPYAIRPEDEVAFVIRPPFNAIAYQLTKEGNGISDLVRFHDVPGLEFGTDVITRRRRGRKTLIALSKRLSQMIIRVEKGVQALIEKRRATLGVTIERTRTLNIDMQHALTTANALVVQRLRPPGALLSQLTNFPKEAEALRAEAEITAANMNELDNLLELLSEAV